MSVFGIRRRLKTGVKKALGMAEGPSDTSAPNWQNRPPEPVRTAPPSSDVPAEDEVTDADIAVAPEPAVEEAGAEDPTDVPEAAVEGANTVEEVSEVEAATPEAVGADDVVGQPLTLEAVQEILDDMVRPALQGDGGDITLLKVEDDNVHVKLVGACTTCPSSVMTMKMGVEALLREEFPSMKELIQEDAMVPMGDDAVEA